MTEESEAQRKLREISRLVDQCSLQGVVDCDALDEILDS